MDFSWSQSQLEFKKVVSEFALRELQDDVRARDKEERFSRELWERCAAFGIQGLPFDPEFGGQGMDIMTTALAMEALGGTCKDNGLIFGMNAQMWSVQMPIATFGTREQKKTYLPRLCSGEWIGGHCMTEPGSGSDAFSLTTTAKGRGDGYVLQGTKTFVSNAPAANIFLVFATVDRRKGFMGVTAFIVERDTPGLRVGKPIGKMGLKTCPWAEVFFDECAIPVSNRLGREGGGAGIFSDSMEWERGCLLAAHIGAMERQLVECVAYARSRKQFGQPIGKFQSVSNRIADMKIRLETARWLLYRVVWAKSQGRKSPMEASMAKLFLSECWRQSSMDAIQIFGGYGYTTEYEIERDLRDAIASSLYSGTSDIQRNIIAGYLGL